MVSKSSHSEKPAENSAQYRLYELSLLVVGPDPLETCVAQLPIPGNHRHHARTMIACVLPDCAFFPDRCSFDDGVGAPSSLIPNWKYIPVAVLSVLFQTCALDPRGAVVVSGLGLSGSLPRGCGR